MEPLSKARIKLIQSLQHKKFRLKYDKFIVEGLKIIKELIEERSALIETVYFSVPDFQPILGEILDPERIIPVTPGQMDQISNMSTPPGILAFCRMPVEDQVPDPMAGKRIFYLDGIRDPGNMGTIFRVADWFGLDFIILSVDCVDVFNHKVLQASMGSVFRVPHCVLDKVGLLAVSGGKIYVCDTSGKSINQMTPPTEGVIVLGNESTGVSPEILQKVKNVISIPGDRSRGAESLNVAAAASIIGAWWVKG